MNPHYETVASRARHRCEYCHAPEAVFNFPFEVEHIIPPNLGGTEAEGNLALACRACNLRKGVHIRHLDPLTQVTVRLYDPRQAAWSEHFDVDTNTGIITGLTAIGRATVARLEMNSPTQLAARKLWIRLGMFP